MKEDIEDELKSEDKIETEDEIKDETKIDENPEDAEEPIKEESLETKELDSDSVEKETKEIVKDVKVQKVRSKAFLIGIGIVTVLALFVLMILIAFTIFKIDGNIWPSSVSGSVQDTMNGPISGVTVCVQSKCVDTDNSGLYSIDKLTYGSFELSFRKDGYTPITQLVDFKRGTEEKISRQMEMIKSGNIILPIKFAYDNIHMSINSDYSFKIDDQSVQYQAYYDNCPDSGQYAQVICKITFYNIPLGTHKLYLESIYYVDLSTDFEVKQGTTTLAEMTLTPSMDITGTVNDGFFGGTLDGAKIKITTPVALEALSDKDGKYAFKDVKIPQNTYPKLKLVYEVSKDGYVTAKSENELDTAYNNPMWDNLLPQGKVVTVSNKLGNKNLISTGIDGSDTFTISDNKGDNYNPVLLKDGKTIRFLSTRDGVKSQYGGSIPMVYQIDIDGKNLKKISKTNYFDNDGIGSFNLVSGKRAYSLYENNGVVGSYSLKVGNIEGTELKTVESNKIDGYYGSIVIADSGDFMLYTWKDNTDQTKSGVYRYNFKTDQIDMLYNIKDVNFAEVKTISQDLNKAIILISSNWDDEGDLWLLKISDKSLTRITNSTTGELKPTFFNNDKSILYLSRRDDLLNVYIWDFGKGTETKITNVSGTDQEFYANMCADLVASTKYTSTQLLIDKALGQENAMCPGPYYRYYD